MFSYMCELRSLGFIYSLSRKKEQACQAAIFITYPLTLNFWTNWFISRIVQTFLNPHASDLILSAQNTYQAIWNFKVSDSELYRNTATTTANLFQQINRFSVRPVTCPSHVKGETSHCRQSTSVGKMRYSETYFAPFYALFTWISRN